MVPRVSFVSSLPLRARLALELCAVAAFAALYVGVFASRPRILDPLLAGMAVAAIALDARRSRGLWATAPGASSAPLARAWAEMALFTAVAAGVLGAYAMVASPPGEAAGRLGNWHLLPAIILYLPWAWLQQFVFQFYLLGRLLHVVPVVAAVALTAAAFSAVHFPRYPVMAATAVAGLVWVSSYRRHRRLAPVAVSHAILGPLLHYWVLGRDLLAGWLP